MKNFNNKFKKGFLSVSALLPIPQLPYCVGDSDSSVQIDEFYVGYYAGSSFRKVASFELFDDAFRYLKDPFNSRYHELVVLHSFITLHRVDVVYLHSEKR